LYIYIYYVKKPFGFKPLLADKQRDRITRACDTGSRRYKMVAVIELGERRKAIV
jgi:hypothetical protein